MERLRRRAEFIAAARGAKAHTAAFVLQARAQENAVAPARFGFTVTRKVGTAVERNRMRRRLKAAVLTHAAPAARAGFDYVLVARRDALSAPFHTLTAALDAAMRQVHSGKATSGRTSGKPAGP